MGGVVGIYPEDYLSGCWLGVCVITHLLSSRKRESPGPLIPTLKPTCLSSLALGKP